MQSTMSKEEIVRRGEERYEREIRSRVESGNQGRFLVLDVLRGDFDIADTVLQAADRVRARHPDAVLYIVRIGYPVAHRIGGQVVGFQSNDSAAGIVRTSGHRRARRSTQ